MINGHKIIAGTFLTNAVVKGYWPTSEYSLKSVAKTPYIDTVLVAEGGSIDSTVEKHSGIEKVQWVRSSDWSRDSFSYDDTANQYSSLLKWCSDLDEDVILMINWGDMIFDDKHRDELHEALKKFIESDKNVMPLCPGVKVLCKCLRTKPYPTPKDFYTVSAYKFRKDLKWSKIVDHEKKLVGDDEPKIYLQNWKTHGYMYEMFTFTKENFKEKVRLHCEWNNEWTIHQAICNVILKKSVILGISKMTRKDHPKDALELFDSVDKDHYGYSCFDTIDFRLVNFSFDE